MDPKKIKLDIRSIFIKFPKYVPIQLGDPHQKNYVINEYLVQLVAHHVSVISQLLAGSFFQMKNMQLLYKLQIQVMLQKRGVEIEFFFLALQCSNFLKAVLYRRDDPCHDTITSSHLVLFKFHLITLQCSFLAIPDASQKK